MIKIHHLGHSQSERIVWLCEELGLAYELVRYQREPDGAAPPAYKALHPAAVAPIVEVDGQMLAETGAIMEYLAKRHGGGRLFLGPEHPDFAQFLFWHHYANGTFLPAIMIDTVAKRLGKARISPRMDNSYDMAERRLGEATWFAGEEFTAADIMMVYPLTSSRAAQGISIADRPNLLAYLQRIGERPAYRAAMARAEPDRPLQLG